MLGTLVGAVLGAGVVRLVVAACGHHLTWRMALLLAVLVALLIGLHH
jgi:hypothetical protein